MTDNTERVARAVAERYRIERRLGEGGMATIYLAEDCKHDRKVALKVLKPELAAVLGAERFVQEIKTTAQLQHPHILPLFDSGTADGVLYYVMPFIEGETLRDKLDRETQLGIDEAVRIAIEVADALDYAHRHGVIHRDIKPENILLHDGRPVVADFGIALAVSAAAGGRMTETGLSLGTPHYMSPEQATAEKEITGRSDVYSLGSVLFEMLTGEPPHDGGSAQQVIMKIIAEAAQPVRELRKAVPPNVAAAVEHALEKLPADRFATARAFADALANPGFGSETPVRGAGAAPAGRRFRVTAVLPWALVAVLALTSGWLATRHDVGAGATEAMHFTIDLDPAEAFPNPSPLILTPDGRTLIAPAVVGRRNVLLSRRLDRLETTVIPGSEDATRAFVSNDGRWVGFVVRNRLVKLPVEGGTPVALADASWGGGAWGDDGNIIYTQTYQSGLWRVSTAGGDAHELTTPDSTTGELAHWWPQIVPGGRYVIFTAYRTPHERASIEVLDLETGTRRVVVAGGVMGRYLPSGHLVFARDRSLLAVPFDVKRLRVTGAAVAVVDDVAMEFTEGFAAYDVSASGTLAVMPSDVLGSRFLVVETDRRGAERLVLSEPDRYAHPRYAPDGRRFSVTITPPRGASDVWLVDRTRGSRTRATSEATSDFGALWTPDGRELIYMSERPLFDLYRRASDGSRAPQLLIGGGHDRILGSISRDGRLLAFSLTVPTGGDLWTVSLRDSALSQLYLSTGSELSHPALSPDGRWMAYDSNESGVVETFIQSFPDPTIARRQVSHGGGSQPVWTQDGRELVFRRSDSVMAAAVDARSGTVGTAAPLFAGPYKSSASWTEPADYDVTADGQHFLLLKWPATTPRRHVTIRTGWFDELRARVIGGTGAK